MTTGLIELAELMVTSAQRRLEIVSSNVANVTTPGYRSHVAFANLIAEAPEALSLSTNFASGPLRASSNPYDLALASDGFFCVRGESGIYYTRAGQFSRDSEGRLVDAQGLVLQSAEGGDLVLARADAAITQEGLVLEDGQAVARIGVYETREPQTALVRVGGAYFAAADGDMQAASEPIVRQSMVEGANVELSTEMLTMMNALRQAEIGARVVQTYDTLLGQSISTLGRV